MVRHWFKATAIHDVSCGLLGFKKESFQSLNQRCTGMEFAGEGLIPEDRYFTAFFRIANCNRTLVDGYESMPAGVLWAVGI
jgi:hypothetical protein